MSLRKCPYCEHPNSTDAKFCVACGAIMHLAPCPHCGAVNDIHSPKCYRCHGDLPGEKALDIEGDAAAPAAAPDATPAASAPEAPSGRPSLLVVSVIALTFASAAYFAYRQRTSIAPPVATPAPAVEARESPAAAGGAITRSVPQPAPAAPAAPAPAAATPAPANALAAEPAPARERGPRVRRTSEAVAPASAPPPAPASAPAATSPAANRGPCTEAVAALGLCKPEAK